MLQDLCRISSWRIFDQQIRGLRRWKSWKRENIWQVSTNICSFFSQNCLTNKVDAWRMHIFCIFPPHPICWRYPAFLPAIANWNSGEVLERWIRCHQLAPLKMIDGLFFYVKKTRSSRCVTSNILENILWSKEKGLGCHNTSLGWTFWSCHIGGKNAHWYAKKMRQLMTCICCIFVGNSPRVLVGIFYCTLQTQVFFSTKVPMKNFFV